MIRLLALLLICVALMGIASACASKGHHDKSASAAMMCPKCETVWVRESSTTGPKNITVWSSKSAMTCPECDAMARSQLLEDGKVMLHACPTCKVTPIRVDPSQSSHAKGTHQ